MIRRQLCFVCRPLCSLPRSTFGFRARHRRKSRLLLLVFSYSVFIHEAMTHRAHTHTHTRVGVVRFLSECAFLNTALPKKPAAGHPIMRPISIGSRNIVFRRILALDSFGTRTGLSCSTVIGSSILLPLERRVAQNAIHFSHPSFSPLQSRSPVRWSRCAWHLGYAWALHSNTSTARSRTPACKTVASRTKRHPSCR